MAKSFDFDFTVIGEKILRQAQYTNNGVNDKEFVSDCAAFCAGNFCPKKINSITSSIGFMLAAISKNYLRSDSMFPVSYFENKVCTIEQKLSRLNSFVQNLFQQLCYRVLLLGSTKLLPVVSTVTDKNNKRNMVTKSFYRADFTNANYSKL